VRSHLFAFCSVYIFMLTTKVIKIETFAHLSLELVSKGTILVLATVSFDTADFHYGLFSGSKKSFSRN
jgi:hypothetical protein